MVDAELERSNHNDTVQKRIVHRQRNNDENDIYQNSIFGSNDMIQN